MAGQTELPRCAMSDRLADVREFLGRADIYVADHLLRGVIEPGMRVLDAGCGNGRNLEPLLRAGCDVHAVDASSERAQHVRGRFGALAPHLPTTNVVTADLADLPHADASFDMVLCLAVLHFARDRAHFDAMTSQLFRVLRPGGLFLARLGTTYGVDGLTQPLPGGRARMFDGKEWLLVTPDDLAARTIALGATLEGPLKTTVVHGQRSMTTWTARKDDASQG